MGSPAGHIALDHNPDAGSGKSVDRSPLRRVGEVARPHRSVHAGPLGGVVSNIVGLAFAVGAMAALEWRLTLMSLVILPAFILPAKWVGRKLQRITRESFQLNASMNATMTERFNVAGAMLVKLFGR